MTTKLGDSFNRVSNRKVKIKLAPLFIFEQRAFPENEPMSGLSTYLIKTVFDYFSPRPFPYMMPPEPPDGLWIE